jgi:hypothetical protein
MPSSLLRRSWPVLILFAIAVVACGTDAIGAGEDGQVQLSSDSITPASTEELGDESDAGVASKEITQVIVIGHPVIRGSMEELIDEADAVVIGSFSADKTERVDSGDPDQIIFGTVYSLNVGQYLMGEGPTSLDIYQYEGLITEASGKKFRSVDVMAFPAPVASQRYLLFIRAHEDDPGVFSGTARPWRFILTDGLAKPDSSTPWILETYPSVPEADFIARVEAAIQRK